MATLPNGDTVELIETEPWEITAPAPSVVDRFDLSLSSTSVSVGGALDATIEIVDDGSGYGGVPVSPVIDGEEQTEVVTGNDGTVDTTLTFDSEGQKEVFARSGSVASLVGDMEKWEVADTLPAFDLRETEGWES